MVRAVCWFGVRLEPPAKLLVAGVDGIELGGDSARTAPLAGLFNRCGIPARCEKSVALVEWRKAIWNAAANGLCAILNERNGVLLEDRELEAAFTQLMDEACRVARACGVALDEADRARAFAAHLKVAANINSTLQDLRAGRPTEMPWLNGAVARLAREKGLDAPANALISRVVGYLEKKSQ